MEHRTQYCQHQGSCIHSAVIGSSQAFIKAFLAKLGINVLLLLLNIRKILRSQQILKEILLTLVNKTNFKLGLFMGLQTLLLKSIQCLLRQIRNKEDPYNSIISGFIAGAVSFSTQEENVQYIVRVYLFGRAVDCIYQSMVQKEYFRHRKIIPVVIFAIMSSLISYCYFFEPELLPLDTYKMYNNFSQQSMNDSIWHMCNIQAHRSKIYGEGLQ
ncbi:hypothetical protein pb186bvf_017327 [Paramecium bursaria]